jgi:hypothetical protein
MIGGFAVSKFGLTYRVADYIGRSLSRRSKDSSSIFALRLIELLKAIDRIQEENPAVTMSVWAGDGIWVCHNGVRLFMILPRINSVRVLYERSKRNKTFALHKSLTRYVKLGKPLHDVARQEDYWLWRIEAENFSLITEFVSSLPHARSRPDDDKHPRNFPGEVRMIALELFERNGRWCPGTKGRARHQVGKHEPVEFDHILPHARGGSRSAINIQVLCEVCNRAKGATPL